MGIANGGEELGSIPPGRYGRRGGPNYDRTSVIPPRRCAESSGLEKESISVGDTGRRAIFARCDEYGERLTAGEYEIVGECEYFRRMATYVLVI